MRRMRSCHGRALAAAIPALLASACSFAPEPRSPVTVRDLPEAYLEAPAEAAEIRRVERWWTVYNDPVLDRLVDSALAANLDLREAVARVEEVRQRYRIARADLLPSLGLSADATYLSSPSNTGFATQIGDENGGGSDGAEPSAAAALFPDRLSYSTYSAALGFSYELDFWGRASNDTRAAVSDFLASEGDYQTARLAVISETISTYFEMVELRRRVELTRLSVDLLRERAELTDERYYRGLVTTFELYSIQSEYRNTQAALPVLESQLEDAKGRLAILLGRYAGRIEDLLGEEAAPAIVMDPVPPDLPASLLDQRPDVWAAWQRMEAARYRIGARKAQLYPSISLNATAGLQSSGIGDLFRVDQYFLNLVGGLLQPLFQGGRLRAGVGVAEAQFQQRAAAYVRTVITAFKEAETSLQNLEKQKERYQFLRRQQASAQGSVDFQLRSFQRGVGDYLEYLDARRNLANTETNLAAAEHQVAEARLAVHRALGGAWVPEEDSGARLEEEFERADEITFGAEGGGR